MGKKTALTWTWGPRGEVLALLLAFALGCAGGGTSSPATAPASAASPAGQTSTVATAGQVLITLKPAPPAVWSRTASELAEIYRLRTIFAWTMISLGEQCVVFEIPRDRAPESILRRLRADPRVGTAQPISTFETLAEEPPGRAGGAYNDPYAHLQRSIQALTLEKAHRWSTGKGVRVAVIDTGVDLDHPDLRGRIARVSNFVEHGEQGFTTDVHGTAVAGVIAATTNNEVGIVGVAPRAEILALKACWPKRPGTREAVCDTYTLARAIDFAITQGAQILNFSLGGPHDPLLARLIGAALERGIVVVAADAGDGRRSFPADLSGVIGVLGVDQVPAAARPRGSPSGLGAPSVDILTTVPHGSYDFFSGSSLAAAQVSGVAALLLEREPQLTPARVAEILRRTSRNHSPLQVDACAALAEALGQGGCE